MYCEQAYAQGKMLDHSQWFGKLPRKIRPSDIDFGFDNAGESLICELSSSKREWSELDFGQRRFYESFVMRGKTIAALCKHEVPTARQIDTFADIKEFQLMFLNQGNLNTSDLLAGDRWVKFVLAWFKDAANVMRALLPFVPTGGATVGVDNPAAPTHAELLQQIEDAKELRMSMRLPFTYRNATNQSSLWK